jgi:hypothetical protein
MVAIYRIAELNIKISTRFDYTTKFLQDYLVESEEYDFSVEVSDEDIKKAYQEFPEVHYIIHENLCIYREICNTILSRYNGVLFHASAVCVDGKAYMFTAPSGTGKSTHSRLLKEYLGDKLKYINDDKPLLRYDEENKVFNVYGTPWNGKHRLGENIKEPLKAICILTRGEIPSIKKVDIFHALPSVITQTLRWTDDSSADIYLDLLDKFSQSVDFYLLKCNISTDSAKCSYEGMML